MDGVKDGRACRTMHACLTEKDKGHSCASSRRVRAGGSECETEKGEGEGPSGCCDAIRTESLTSTATLARSIMALHCNAACIAGRT